MSSPLLESADQSSNFLTVRAVMFDLQGAVNKVIVQPMHGQVYDAIALTAGGHTIYFPQDSGDILASAYVRSNHKAEGGTTAGRVTRTSAKRSTSEH